MPNREIELVLMRQLASYLNMPILVVDPDGDLLFFNEAAEPIIGRRFEETGVIRSGEWSRLFRPSDENGEPLPREEQPLFIARSQRKPAFRRSWVRGLDGVDRQIEGIAFPLIGQGDRFLGAAGIFWEVTGE
jgi:PAS domain-containing protein